MRGGMNVLVPWFRAIKHKPRAFQQALARLGISSPDGWVAKAEVLECIDQLYGVTISQKQVWAWVYDARKGLEDEFNYLFPEDPLSARKRSFCYFSEAWFALAVVGIRHEKIDRLLCHFNLDLANNTASAKTVLLEGGFLFDGVLTVHAEGLIEGFGILKIR